MKGDLGSQIDRGVLATKIAPGEKKGRFAVPEGTAPRRIPSKSEPSSTSMGRQVLMGVAMPRSTSTPFEGFSSPNGTVVPDELFDVLMPQLTEAELRVLLYIIRRTFGFKKSSDDISLRQIVDGITTKDGRALDHGAGVGKTAAVRAIKGLAERGVIVAQRNMSTERGNEPSTYAVRFKDDPLFTKGTRGGSPSELGLVHQGNTQQTVLQQTGRHNSNIRDATHQDFSDGNINGRGIGAPQTLPLAEPTPASQDAPAASPPRPRLVRPEQLAARRGAGKPVAVGESLRRRRHPAGSTDDREVIVAYLSDFAREMNDQAPLRVSVTRALNLLSRSGLPRDAFLRKLYEARSLTKEYSASIQTTVKRNGSPVPVKAKMAYFFAVLEDLLGLKDESTAVPPN